LLIPRLDAGDCQGPGGDLFFNFIYHQYDDILNHDLLELK